MMLYVGIAMYVCGLCMSAPENSMAYSVVSGLTWPIGLLRALWGLLKGGK